MTLESCEILLNMQISKLVKTAIENVWYLGVELPRGRSQRIFARDMLPRWLEIPIDTRTETILKRDKERCARGLNEAFEGCLHGNNLRVAIRALEKLHFKFTSQTSTMWKTDEQIVYVADEYRARWAEYFKHLCISDPQTDSSF